MCARRSFHVLQARQGRYRPLRHCSYRLTLLEAGVPVLEEVVSPTQIVAVPGRCLVYCSRGLDPLYDERKTADGSNFMVSGYDLRARMYGSSAGFTNIYHCQEVPFSYHEAECVSFLTLPTSKKASTPPFRRRYGHVNKLHAYRPRILHSHPYQAPSWRKADDSSISSST